MGQKKISGSDLTNQIVGVLTRFYEEPVAIFLWWEDHDINGSARDFEICVHVFGGTLSPCCCNYTLK